VGVLAGGIESRGAVIDEVAGAAGVGTVVDEVGPVVGGVTEIRQSIVPGGIVGGSVDIERRLFGPDVPDYVPGIGVGRTTVVESGFSGPGPLIDGPDSDGDGFSIPAPGPSSFVNSEVSVEGPLGPRPGYIDGGRDGPYIADGGSGGSYIGDGGSGGSYIGDGGSGGPYIGDGGSGGSYIGDGGSGGSYIEASGSSGSYIGEVGSGGPYIPGLPLRPGLDSGPAQLEGTVSGGDGFVSAGGEVLGGGSSGSVGGGSGYYYEERRSVPLLVGGQVQGRFIRKGKRDSHGCPLVPTKLRPAAIYTVQ
jgi:hypothetical protein